MALSSGYCPFCRDYGIVEFVTSEPSGTIVLLCDECYAMWLDPANIGTDQVFSGDTADTVISGTPWTLQRTHHSTEEEVQARGWSEYVKLKT